MITWNDTFEIIKRMFNINQNQIADKMNVPKYTITKIKKGNLTSAFDNEDIYRKIFDPNTKDSPAKDTEKYLLSTLEDIIKNGFDNVKEAMKDYWVEDDKYKAGDYKIFVIKMLERTRYISSSKDRPASSDINNGQELLAHDVIEDTPISDKTGETSPNTEAAVTLDEAESACINNEQEPLVPDAVHENESNDQEANETQPQPERMLVVCQESFNDFPIEDFIDSNPAKSIKCYLIQDAVTVVGRIQFKHNNKDSPDIHSEIYQIIVKFADALLEYLKTLKGASGNLNILDEGYTPLEGEDNGLIEEAERHRQQLKSLYQIINVKIEKRKNDVDEQLRVEQKESWEKNTLKSSL